MRPGVYVFNDLDQEFIGSCGAGDLALSVLASVIGHYPHRNQLLVDAGAFQYTNTNGTVGIRIFVILCRIRIFVCIRILVSSFVLTKKLYIIVF